MNASIHSLVNIVESIFENWLLFCCRISGIVMIGSERFALMMLRKKSKVVSEKMVSFSPVIEFELAPVEIRSLDFLRTDS